MKLFEMAAKKLCPQCGKTMAANHYWYKGGWRCKKPNEAVANADTDGVVAAPAETKRAPKLSKEMLQAIVPQGEGPLDWTVSDHNGMFSVSWELTFRRNTSFGAYQENKRAIDDANARIMRLASQYGPAVVDVRYATPESTQRSDMRRADNEGSAYSEYEQSFGGYIDIKAK